MLITQKIIKRSDLISNKYNLYIFGDNIERWGNGGQAAEMRGEPNAVGIPTKKSPYEYLTNNDYEMWYKASEKDFKRLFEHERLSRIIVWPEDDIGSGRANLKITAPKIYDAIQLRKAQLINSF